MTIATNTTQQTKKQKEMSTARSPKNFGFRNDFNDMEDQSSKFRKQQQEFQPVIDPHEDSGAAKPRDTTTEDKVDKSKNEPLRRVVQENIKNLGTFGLQVQGRINKFVNKGKGLIGATGGTFAEWKDEQGAWGLGDTMEEDVSGLVEGKERDQENLDELLSEWYDTEGDREAMSFTEGIEREANRLADKYPDIVKKQDYLLGLADRLQMLEDEGLGNSAEARALRQSIRLEDDQGLIQMLYGANREYRRNVFGEEGEGVTFSGDGFTEFSAHDFATLTADELEKEIRNVSVGGLGIFNGDYAANIKRQLDEMREEYLKSGREEVKRNEEYTRLAEEFLDQWGDDMGANAEEIQQTFQDAITALEDKILNMDPEDLPEGVDSSKYNVDREEERGELAKSYLSTLGGGDFRKGMEEFLNDPSNGLQARQRSLLREFIGSDKARSAEGGELNSWMHSLATGQPIQYQGNDLRLTADEKAQVIRAAYSRDEDHIEDVFKNNMRRINVDLDGLLEQTAKGEHLDDALDVWKDSIANSVQNFLYSKTEDSVKEGLGIGDAEWKDMTVQEKHMAMTQVARGGYENFDSLVRGASGQINAQLGRQLADKKAAIERNKQNALQVLEQAKAVREKLEGEYHKAVESSKQVSGVKTGYDKELADRYLENLDSSKEGLHNNRKIMQDAIERGKLSPGVENKVAQAGAIVSQVRALQSHPQGQEIGNRMVKELNKLIPGQKRDGLEMTVTGLPPLEIATAQQRSNAVDKMQRVWDSGVNEFNSNIRNQINEELSNAKKLHSGMTETIDADISKATQMLEDAARDAQIVAQTEKELAQGVFTPRQVMNLALEQARRIEQAGNQALQSMLEAYPKFNQHTTAGDNSAYYDMGGFEGRDTVNELLKKKDSIARRKYIAGSTGLNPSELSNVVKKVAPVKKPGMAYDWVQDRRSAVKPVSKGGSQSPVDQETNRPINIVSDPQVQREVQKDIKSWTQSGQAQSGKMKLPDGRTVDGYYWRDQQGDAQFMPDIKSLETPLNRMGNEVLYTVAHYPDWAKKIMPQTIVDRAEEFAVVSAHNLKELAALNADGRGDSQTKQDAARLSNLSPTDQKRYLESRKKQVADGIRNTYRLLGVKPPDGLDSLSATGLSNLERQVESRLEQERAQERRKQQQLDEESRDTWDRQREQTPSTTLPSSRGGINPGHIRDYYERAQPESRNSSTSRPARNPNTSRITQ